MSGQPATSLAGAQPVGATTVPAKQPALAAPQAASAPRSSLRRAIARAIEPLTRRAARAYVAGDTLDEALATQAALASARRYSALGYWSDAEESPAHVLKQYEAALAAMAANHLSGVCSVKLPALAFRPELLDQLVAAARKTGVALHCDSHGPEDADRTRAVIEGWQLQGVTAGTTLPGRWQRSVDDAQWAIEKKLPIRVVKGQWADPAAPHRDLRAGYLEVIDALAGRAASVGVASHDVELAAIAIERLRRQGTPVIWELLYGLPTKEALRTAQRLAVDVRIYVPFGRSYLPYALGRLAAQPRMAMWLIKDLLSGGR